MRIGLCQVDSQWEDRAATRERIAKIVDVASSHVDCLVFPEMVLSGFSMDRRATTLDGVDHAFFTALAARTGAVALYGGVEDGHNCVFMARPDGTTASAYRKRHLFAYGGERDNYEAGEGNAIVEIGGARFGLAICYDLRFAYHFWQQAQACDGYIIIASWPESRREHWTTLLRARAIENQAYVVGVNRVGRDPKLVYAGDSAVFGPFGERILECGDGEGVYACQIDPARTAAVREKYRFFEDRLQ